MDKIKTLKHNFELTANGYVNVLCNMWDLDKDYSYWIGDEIGGLLDFSDGYITITYDNIRYCVERNVKLSEYEAWQKYCDFCHEFKQTMPNFRSWYSGCPRLSDDERKHLISLKAEFEKACKDAKEKTLF